MHVWSFRWPGQHLQPEVHTGVFPCFGPLLSAFETKQMDILADLVSHQVGPASARSWRLSVIILNKELTLCNWFIEMGRGQRQQNPWYSVLISCLSLSPARPHQHWRLSWLLGTHRVIVDLSLCPLDPQDYVFFFLIFKEAYLQGEGKVSQRNGGGRENEPSIC